MGALLLGVLGFILLKQGWGDALGVEKPDPDDFARWGTSRACLVNSLLLGVAGLGMLLRTRLLLRGSSREDGVMAGEERGGGAGILRREWLWLLVVLALAGALRWPRMGLSFYNDEAHTFRNYIAGRFKPADDGGLKWRQAKWSETLWLNKAGNNMAPCSIFGRLCYDAWKKLSGAADGAVSEKAVRLPQFLAGMLSLVVLWLAGRRAAGVQASWCVVILAALHPWHVRYSTEARAYGFLLLGVACCLWFLVGAVREGRWRWWLGLGLAQFLCLWSFSGSVYFLLVLDAGILAWLCWCARGQRGAWVMVFRFVAGLLAGAVLVVQLMLPGLVQLVQVMRTLESAKGEMGYLWWMDALSGLLHGIRGFDSDPGNPDNMALWRTTSRWPWVWLLVAGVAGGWLAGMAGLFRRSMAAGIFAIAGPLGVLLSWGVMGAQGNYLHTWYVLFAVPGMVLSIAMLPGVFSKRRAAAWVLLLATAASWLAADLGYLRRGKEDLRGLADAAAREGGVYAAMLSDVDVYEPRVLTLKSAAALDDAIALARASGRKLTVSVGHVGIGETEQVYQRLAKSGEFEPVAEIRGLDEAQFTHYLFRSKMDQ